MERLQKPKLQQRASELAILPSLCFNPSLRLSTFINDGIRAWNNAPLKIKSCSTYASAKMKSKNLSNHCPFE